MGALVPLLVLVAAFFVPGRWLRLAGGHPLAATLAPALAFGCLSLLYFAWRLAGLGNGSFPLAGWVVVAGAIVWGLAEAARRPAASAFAGLWPERTSLLAMALAAGALAYLGIAFYLYTRQVPVGQFDAWAIWTSRARLLFRAEDPAATFSLLRRAHPDYPLFLPGALAAEFALLGHAAHAIPQWTGAIFPAAGAAVLAVGVRLLGAPARWAWVAAALLLSTPLWIYWGFAQCADVPLAYLAAAAALVLALRIRDGSRAVPSPWLCGFLAGLPAWAKNEGMILSLILLGLFGAWSLRASRRWGIVGRVALGAALPWAAVLAFRLAWAPRSDLRFFLDAPWKLALQAERWRTVGASFAERLNPFSGFTSWGLVWLLAAAGIAAALSPAARRRPEIAFLLTLVGCCWLVWFGIFVATPHDVAWQVRTALDRLMLQLLPLTLMTAFAGAGLAAREPS